MHYPPLRVVDLGGAWRLDPLEVALDGQFSQLIRRHRHPVVAVMALQIDDVKTVAPAAAVDREVEAHHVQRTGHFLVDFRQPQGETATDEQSFVDQDVQTFAA
ncbi:hypothetical protein D3C80_1846270 [compost metagenome]